MKRAAEKTLPPAQVLTKYFRYESRTGKLFHRRRPLSEFRLAAWGRHWNKRWSGKEAGSFTDFGHLTVRLFGKAYKVHRVIWKMVRGTEPPSMLDHRDRKPSSNKDSNLRAASYAQNTINRNKQAGLKQTRNGNWEARIHKDKKYIYLGTFKSKLKAAAVRRQAAVELYGEFAP